MGDYRRCKVCRKMRVMFYGGMCQSCYKKQPKARTYELRVEPTNKVHQKVVKMFLKNKVPRPDIAEYFDMTKRNVDIILKKYCIKK